MMLNKVKSCMITSIISILSVANEFKDPRKPTINFGENQNLQKLWIFSHLNLAQRFNLIDILH